MSGILSVAIGVHTNLAGTWVVNGCFRGLVALEIDPPAVERTIGIPIQIRRLEVSLEDPEGLLAALGR